MKQVTGLAVSGLLLLTTFGGAVIAADQQLSCKGEMIVDPEGQQKAPIALNLNIGGPGNTTIEMDGGKKVKVRVISDNKFQLKFQLKQDVVEFFPYSSELFIIYKSGHLARLDCSRS
jgi:hypothetical protein